MGQLSPRWETASWALQGRVCLLLQPGYLAQQPSTCEAESGSPPLLPRNLPVDLRSRRGSHCPCGSPLGIWMLVFLLFPTGHFLLIPQMEEACDGQRTSPNHCPLPASGREGGSSAEVTVSEIPVAPAVPGTTQNTACPLTLSWENLGGFWGGSS